MFSLVKRQRNRFLIHEVAGGVFRGRRLDCTLALATVSGLSVKINQVKIKLGLT